MLPNPSFKDDFDGNFVQISLEWLRLDRGERVKEGRERRRERGKESKRKGNSKGVTVGRKVRERERERKEKIQTLKRGYFTSIFMQK